MNIIFIIFIVIVVAIILALICLMIYIKVQSNKHKICDKYYEDFKSLSKLELKYAKMGSCNTTSIEYNSNNKYIKKIFAWIPSELENINKKFPMIVVVNPSNTKAKDYKQIFDKLASWGFIVFGNDDPQTGNGKISSITLDYILNNDGIIQGKIDIDNIGIIGYSKGGVGGINVVTRYDNGKINKKDYIFRQCCLFTFI